MRVGFESDQPSIVRKAASEPDRAVATERPDLEYRARADRPREYVEKLSLGRRDIVRGQSGRCVSGKRLVEGVIRGHEQISDVTVDCMPPLLAQGRSRRSRDRAQPTIGRVENVEIVKRFLRGQNLEQVGRVDEAVELYESAVAEAFDSTGPYDRLIGIYSNRALHADVIRVADSALANVKTYEDKRAWYRDMKAHAEAAAAAVPRAAPKSQG
jgi:hypothetical protein